MSFNWMAQFLSFYVNSSMFILGDVVINQTKGVPMGGGASKIASSLLPAHHESQRLTIEGLGLFHGFRSGGLRFSNNPGVIRSVDDLPLLSFVYCQSCLTDMLHCNTRSAPRDNVQRLG